MLVSYIISRGMVQDMIGVLGTIYACVGWHGGKNLMEEES